VACALAGTTSAATSAASQMIALPDFIASSPLRRSLNAG
jgi:hypothetical protein